MHVSARQEALLLPAFSCGQEQGQPGSADAISHFLAKTGRIGYLAVVFWQGPEKTGEAFLIPWPEVIGHYATDKGVTIIVSRSSIVLARSKDGYLIEILNAK